MLEDPDSLMQYPEIRVLLEAGDGGAEEEDWEKDFAQADLKLDGSDALKEESVSDAAQANRPQVEVANKEYSKSVGKSTGEDDEEEDTEDVGTFELEETDPREHVNIVFIGHVDAGKSTLSGSILYLMGKVDKRTIERFEREAKDRNRESWFLAFIMDTSDEERAKGKTVEVGRAHFETEINRYTILDAPGHKNYVPNMISGASQADVGVLVISARKGEFETGFEKGGQTREHALLARTLGIDHLIVVINKMDDPTVEWSMERYEECVTKLKPYLKQVGYTIKTEVKFIPISALSGDNVLKEVDPSVCPWWREKYTSGAHNTTTSTLISTLDSLKMKNRDPTAPLRMPCLDRYLERGCIVLGKVESGIITVGDEICIAPTRKMARIDEICIDEKKVKYAKPGEDVLVKLNVGVEDIQKGYVLCQSDRLCPIVRQIKAQLAMVDVLEHRPVFTPGYTAVMHVHTVEIEVICLKLLHVIEGSKKAKRPYAKKGQMCVAILGMELGTCMEAFDKMPAMGRLTLRDEGRTIAIGKILEVKEADTK